MGSFTRPEPPEGCRHIVIVGAGGFRPEKIQCPRPRSWCIAIVTMVAVSLRLSAAEPENGASNGSNQQATTGLAPVPALQSQRTAAAKLREVFAAEYGEAKTVEKKRAFAKALVAHADGASLATERWVMLSEAMRLSIESGDIPTALTLLNRIPREFAVKADPESRLEILTKLAAKAESADVDAVGREILSLARAAAESRDQELLSKAVSTAASLARRTKNPDLSSAAADLQAEQKERQREAKAEATIAEKLSRSPDDPDVCLEAGKFYCFKMDDWARGLPLIAAGPHGVMAQAASAEIASTKKGSQSVSLADRWWEVAETEAGATKAAIQTHAADLYRRGLDSLTGLDKVRVEKRIAVAATAGRRAGGTSIKRMPGLVLWLDAGDLQSFEPPMRRGGEATRISVWRDISGRGNDAKQPDPAKQPLWSAEAFDGSPGAVFSGGQTLAVPMPCGRAGTILVTLRAKSVGNMRFLGCYRNVGEHVGLCLRSDGSVWAEAMTPGNATAVARSQPSAYYGEHPIVDVFYPAAAAY